MLWLACFGLVALISWNSFSFHSEPMVWTTNAITNALKFGNDTVCAIVLFCCGNLCCYQRHMSDKWRSDAILRLWCYQNHKFSFMFNIHVFNSRPLTFFTWFWRRLIGKLISYLNQLWPCGVSGFPSDSELCSHFNFFYRFCCFFSLFNLFYSKITGGDEKETWMLHLIQWLDLNWCSCCSILEFASIAMRRLCDLKRRLRV